MKSQLFDILSVKSKREILDLSQKTGVSYDMLTYYNTNNLLPSYSDLQSIADTTRISKIEIMLSMGIYDNELISKLSQYATTISKVLPAVIDDEKKHPIVLNPAFKTNFGKLYNADCLQALKEVEHDSIDLIFADPPFNLNKSYPSNIDDNLIEGDYIRWSEKWIDECIRVLKPGGSFFLWNIPKWNTYFSKYLNERLTFRHWIVSDIKFSLPIKGKLYPSHYSMLYYCKGNKPNYFNADRLPMEICPKCKSDLKDYGGYKDKMNPLGINMTDVWYDIPPVRHSKYKKRKGANELSIRLLDRVIEMASQTGDTILDPFGGSGTTYITAEIKKRNWIGIEIGPIDEIISRFADMHSEEVTLSNYRKRYNKLFSDEDTIARKKKGLWTHETFIKEEQLFIPIAV
ncbi:MAG: site-specific DNA-methyltransferase [Spirosoma sp.]|nr:site-specific DNA-methyltransferase [Spirosoma sp.]